MNNNFWAGNNNKTNSNDGFDNGYSNEKSSSENLDDSLYTDGADKKPKMILIGGGIVIVLIIVLIAFFSCGKGEKSSNNYLTSITVTGGTFTPVFDKDTSRYDVLTDKEIVTISCTAESSKSTLNGCNERAIIDDACIEHQIAVTSEDKSERTYTLNICNQAKNAPVIKSVKINPTKYTNSKVTVTVTAQAQDGNKLHSEAYSFDDGLTWQAKNSITLTENAIVNIKVRDSKNVESATMTKEINNIDKTKPKVSISGSTESGVSTTSNVILDSVVKPSTTTSDYKYQWYKNNNKISGATSASYTATSSGTYKVVVRTGAGNSATSSNYKVVKKSTGGGSGYTISINKISGNPTAWTTRDVTLTIEGSASNGLNNKAYSFDGGSTWQASNSKTFTKNQTVKMLVRDIKGNKSSVSTQTISKIDKTMPSISVSGGSSVGSQLSVSVTPSTTPSGYTYQWYKNDSAIANATSKTYTTTNAGTYKVRVSTGSGNSVTSGGKSVTVPVIITPSLSLTGSVSSGAETTSNVVLTARVTNGTASSYTWYKNNSQVSGSSSTYTATSSGTYKVVVKTTSGDTLTSNTYVVNIKAPTPTDTEAPTCTWYGPSSSPSSFLLKTTYAKKGDVIYFKSVCTDDTKIVDFETVASGTVFQRTSFYSKEHTDKKWTEIHKMTVGEGTGKFGLAIYNIKDSSNNTNYESGFLSSAITIDNNAPYAPYIDGFDCTDDVEITEGTENIVVRVGMNNLINSPSKKGTYCISNELGVSITKKDDDSGIDSCYYSYPTDTTCMRIKPNWKFGLYPSTSSMSCDKEYGKNLFFAVKCKDKAGNWGPITVVDSVINYRLK